MNVARKRLRCVLCGQALARTPQLTIWTRKGPVHVGCAVRSREVTP